MCVCFIETCTHCVIQAGFDLMVILQLSLLGVGIVGVCHHTQLKETFEGNIITDGS